MKLDRTAVFGIFFILFLVVPIVVALIVGKERLVSFFSKQKSNRSEVKIASSNFWNAPDSTTIPVGKVGDEIRYGLDLIAHTAKYLGPKGKVMPISNGMNCQNCHLNAGTKIFGNNYSAVASTYPKFRARSGASETIEKRVNDCIERSLNGSAIANDSREMRAMVAYIKWVGKDVPTNVIPQGAGLMDLDYLETPANPAKGKLLYDQKCAPCHGKNGEGITNGDGITWTYPPLWGSKSYNDGAGLYRLSRFAGYIKANMPLGAAFDQPQLTNEECWNLAAYVNSFNRPVFDKSKDWPDISKKPVDHPFGPFTDGFDETQHKFGPFRPILEERERVNASQ
jgi:thiosulfate dehydrogenase